MTEEEFTALEEVIDAKIEQSISQALGRNWDSESTRYRELRQEFINVFIFGDKPSS